MLSLQTLREIEQQLERAQSLTRPCNCCPASCPSRSLRDALSAVRSEINRLTLVTPS